jgi:hypothetical protein
MAAGTACWSVVIPTRNTRELTCRCLASLGRVADLQVIVVDDASDDGTRGEIECRFPGVEVIRFEQNVGFTAAANAGISRTSRPYILLLNSDTEVPVESWSPLCHAFGTRPALGVAGAQLIFPNGDLQWSGGSEPSGPWLFALASGLPRLLALLPGYRAVRPVQKRKGWEVEWVSGAAMAFRRGAWERVGPFDEDFRLYCQDLDFCLRTRQAGWEVAILREFRVVHHHGATISTMAGAADRQNPELLWTDLARWAGKHHGEAGARAAIRAMSWGGRLRLFCRNVGGMVRHRRTRDAWKRDSLSYQQALKSLERYRATQG